MPFSSRILPRILTVLGVAAGVSLPCAANAQENIGISAGISLSVSIGRKHALGLGVDVRMTGLFRPGCSEKRPTGAGIFVQATWFSLSAGRFTAGLHGGGMPVPAYNLDGELGWTYRTGDEAYPAEHGIHVGVLQSVGLSPKPATPMSLDASLRFVLPVAAEMIVPEVTAGVGARFLAPFQSLVCEIE